MRYMRRHDALLTPCLCAYAADILRAMPDTYPLRCRYAFCFAPIMPRHAAIAINIYY